MEYHVGDVILIKDMKGEPSYNGKLGRIEFIDDAGQLHGSWGGLAILPETDDIMIIVKTSHTSL